MSHELHIKFMENALREAKAQVNIMRQIVNSLTNDNISLNVSFTLLTEDKKNLEIQVSSYSQELARLKEEMTKKDCAHVANDSTNVVKMKPGRKKKVQA